MISKQLATPGRLIVSAAVILITFGTLLLLLPGTTTRSISFIDLLFTAVSTTTVTGLLTVPLDQFSLFGKCIILVLMQIGGLGLITLMIFLVTLFRELGTGAQLLSGEILEYKSRHHISVFIPFIIAYTIFSELVGFCALWLFLPDRYMGFERLFYSLFHSVSSFCNVGLVIFPDGIEGLKTHIPFLLITGALITLGGFGFVSSYELMRAFRAKMNKKPFKLSLHTRVVILTTMVIALLAAVLFWLLEFRHSETSFLMGAVNALFEGISVRSTGFSTFNIIYTKLPTLLIIMIVSFIGSSPGSTGSGIKTTTFAIFLATVRSVITGTQNVYLHTKRIANDQIFKALAVLTVSLSWIIITLFALLLTQHGWQFIDLIFETFSAFANLGLSTGVTPFLTLQGKAWIILMMIVGRIGALTLIIAIKQRSESKADTSEERVMLH